MTTMGLVRVHIPSALGCVRGMFRLRRGRSSGLGIGYSSSLENTALSGDGGDGFEGAVDLGAGVLAGHDGADAGFAFGDGGEGDAGGHDAGVEQRAGEVHGAAGVAEGALRSEEHTS